MSRLDKPMLDVKGQIDHLKKKGVKFELISEVEAEEYLRQNNNYFKLRAYRKNFPKHPGGAHEGEYINLDFAELKDLSIIDMRMRYVFMHMALDIEHFSKVKLLHIIENSDDDGYQIVEDYIAYLKEMDEKTGTKYYDKLKIDLNKNKGNPYCGGIIEKYQDEYPVWAFVEIISFGTLVHFIKFCAEQLKNKDLLNDFYLLFIVKDIRNAAAHSNCVIHELGKSDAKFSPSHEVSRALSSISKERRRNHFGNERMRQIITLLYTHKKIVSSTGVRDNTKRNLYQLIDRMYHHIEYYNDNSNILESFSFFKNCVDILFD